MSYSRKAQDNNTHLELLVINHASLDAPVRVVNDFQSLTSNGDEYLAWPFELIRPDSGGDAPPRAQLKISNVDVEIVRKLRQLDGTPTISMYAVVAEDPDVVEFEVENLEVETIQYDDMEITAELVFENILVEQFPGDSYTPQWFTAIL